MIPVPNRNVGIYYLLTIAQSCVFISGNWIFFWLRLMTYGQLGLVDASAFAFGLVMEVPTGAVSDLIGKRRTLIAALALNALGFFVMGAGDTLWVLVGGFLLTQLGWALFSGAADALVYDSLKERGQEAGFDRVMAAAHTLGSATLVLSTLAGGVLYAIDVRLPHYAWGVALALGTIAAWYLREPSVDTLKFSLHNYLTQLWQGFRQLARRELRHSTPLIFITLGVYYLYSYGLISPAIAASFGFFAGEQAVVYAVLGALAVLAVSALPWMRRRLSDRQGLVALALLLGAAFLSVEWAKNAVPLQAVFGFGVMLAIRLVGALATPWASVVVNREIPSEYRATTLSTVALLARLPYVATAITAGALAEAGQIGAFSTGVGVFVLAATAAALVWGAWAAARRYQRQ